MINKYFKFAKKKFELIKKNLKRYAPLIIIMTILSVVVLSSFYYLLQPKITLPVYSPNMISTELVDQSIQYVKNITRFQIFH